MPLSLAQARTLVLAYLRRIKKDAQPDPVLGHSKVWAELAQRHGVKLEPNDDPTLRQVFHELYLERVIVAGLGTGGGENEAMAWPFYRITEYGRKVLNNPEYEPHDPDGYLALLKAQIPNVDTVIVRYLEEALGCYRFGFLLAAAVMTGCAAEKAILLLVETYGRAIVDPAKKAKFEKDTQSWIISRKYEALWKRLEPTVPSLPPELGDDLHTILDRTFDLIRTTRNDAGHPAGKQPDRDAVHANLILFPVYCRRVYGLIDYFSKNPVV